MSGRMSSRERIARLAQAAEIERKEKAAKKSTPAADKPARATKSRSKTKAATTRIKIMWAVCDQTGAQVQLFPYAQEQEAQAEAKLRTENSGKTHFVNRAEVPFE